MAQTKKATCSIRDVANHANVAASTVSRVLTGRMGNLHVAEATRERILSAARELNYTPNINAKRLFSHESKVIALVLPALRKCGYHVFADRHFIDFFPGIENALAQTDYRLLIVFNDERFVGNRDYLGLFREHAVDGMLVWGAREEESFWSEVDEAKMPLMFLTNPSGEYCNSGFMLHDYVAAGRLVLEHLYEKGHRHIGWIGGFRQNGTTRSCEEGFVPVLAAHPDLTLYREYGDFLAPEAVHCAERLLQSHSEITALAVSNASAADGVWQMLREHGVAVPERMALAACDGISISEKSDVTRILVDDFKLGNDSVMQLIDVIRGVAESTSLRLPVSLQPGLST